MLEDEIKNIAMMVGAKIKESLAGDGSQLYKAALHLPTQGGKRMRPFLVVKACEAVGGSLDDALSAATAIELIHNFTLVHDDIMDNDVLRRGVPTVHTLWGVPIGILAGDLLFAEAMHVLLSAVGDPERLRRSADILAKATIALSEGQYLDMSFESRAEVTEAEYIEMIRRKTGILFQAGGELGGTVGDGDDLSVSLLGSYGMDLGIGFQIFDDYLGITSSEEVLGKSVGNDIREGKKTLIVIKALRSPLRGRMLSVLGRKEATDNDMELLVEGLRAEGILEYVRGRAEFYKNRAKKAVMKLPQSTARDLLTAMADYAVNRRK